MAKDVWRKMIGVIGCCNFSTHIFRHPVSSIRTLGIRKVLCPQVGSELALTARELLLDRLRISCPAPAEMIGSLASIPLPVEARGGIEEANAIKQSLFDRYRIEVPVFRLDSGATCLRISAQAYNRLDQYERLASAVSELLR